MEYNLSYSSLNQMNTCERAWYLQRVMGKKQPQGGAASWGKAFETEAIKRMGLVPEARSDGRENDETVLEGEEHAAVCRAVDLYLSTPGNWNALPGEIVSQHELRVTPDQWMSLCDEYGVVGQIHLPFIGYIDLLRTEPNGVVRHIADIKTSTRAEMQMSWIIQCTLYALLTRARKCEIHLTTRYQSKAKIPKPDTYQTYFYGWYPTEEHFKWAMTWVNTLAERCRIAEGSTLNRMRATPSYACSWCPDPTSCAAYSLSELAPFSSSKGASE